MDPMGHASANRARDADKTGSCSCAHLRTGAGSARARQTKSKMMNGCSSPTTMPLDLMGARRLFVSPLEGSVRCRFCCRENIRRLIVHPVLLVSIYLCSRSLVSRGLRLKEYICNWPLRSAPDQRHSTLRDPVEGKDAGLTHHADVSHIPHS